MAWEKLYGGKIEAGFRNTITSTAAGSANQFMGQSRSARHLAGAMLVLEGEMTLGQLIAFRILSGYVTSPLLRLASLWQNFQKTALSLERLSDIVNHRKEIEIAERIFLRFLCKAASATRASFRRQQRAVATS